MSAMADWIREKTRQRREKWIEEGRQQAREALRRETEARREGYARGYADAKAGKRFMPPGHVPEDFPTPLA